MSACSRWSRSVAVLGLAAASPVLLVAAALIRVSSPGPIFFRARRAGYLGEEFRMLKLRTMHTGASSQPASRITGGSDPRVFPVGRILRRLKIDEIPQLVNIARGEMAFVGPRPEDYDLVQEHYSPKMLDTLNVLPGLTSPGSLAYYGSEADLPHDPDEAQDVYLAKALPEKVALDLVYIEQKSLLYDFSLVVRTFAQILGLTVFSRQRTTEKDRSRKYIVILNRESLAE